jgi:hypothetical protein
MLCLRKRANAHDRFAGIDGSSDLRPLTTQMLDSPAYRESGLDGLQGMILYGSQSPKDSRQISLTTTHDPAGPFLDDAGAYIQQRFDGLQENLGIRLVTGEKRRNDLHRQNTHLLAHFVRSGRRQWQRRLGLVAGGDLMMLDRCLCLATYIRGDLSVWFQHPSDGSVAESFDLLRQSVIVWDDTSQCVAVRKRTLGYASEPTDEFLEHANSAEFNLIGDRGPPSFEVRTARQRKIRQELAPMESRQLLQFRSLLGS